MNRNMFVYAIIAVFIAFSIGMFAISVHFSSAPVEAQEVPTGPPSTPPPAPPSPPSPSPPPVRTEVSCAGFWLDWYCDRSLGSFGEIDGDDPYLHYISCAAGHKHWSCNPIFRRRHANCRAPAPASTSTTQTARQTSSSSAQSPSQSPSSESACVAAAVELHCADCPLQNLDCRRALRSGKREADPSYTQGYLVHH